MSIQVTIINGSDSFGLGTQTEKRKGSCPHCGHQPQPERRDDLIIHPRDSSTRIIRCGDKLILEALHDDGVPHAHM